MSVRSRERTHVQRQSIFWAGAAAVTVGVGLHLPMFLGASEMHYRLDGMPIDMAMIIGMTLLMLGIAATVYGLWPSRASGANDTLARVSIQPLDDAPISRAHIVLLAVMSLAVTIDVMKPVTLGFVVPGMAQEYGLKSALNPDADIPVAWFPFISIIGTVLGSIVWGYLGERIGRKGSIMLAGILFIATAVCGSMPNFYVNIVTCFFMGAAVGGMLPIMFTLISETMPVRRRGFLMVLIGGDVAGAYLITSWLASALTPEYGWRILWLLGMPTGVLLILLNRWIPESPRFLIVHGRVAEARAVLARYGAKVVPEAESELEVERGITSRWGEVLGAALRRNTLIIGLFGLGIGLITFGFQLWLPSNLQVLGFKEAKSDIILRNGALIGLPATIIVAWMYGFWSARKTMILLALTTAAALVTLAALGSEVANHTALLYILLAIPLTATSSMLAMLLTYSSEVYPTKLRSRGTAIAAGASKLGGVAIIGLVLFQVAPPSIVTTALVGAIPLALTAICVSFAGVETRHRGLEQITAAELVATTAVGRP